MRSLKRKLTRRNMMENNGLNKTEGSEVLCMYDMRGKRKPSQYNDYSKPISIRQHAALSRIELRKLLTHQYVPPRIRTTNLLVRLEDL